MKKKRSRRPTRVKSEEPTNSFATWPHEPDYKAVALVRKAGLWAVLELQMQKRAVVDHEITHYTNFEGAIDKAIRRLAQSVRR